MKIEDTALAGVQLLQPGKHGDHRGFFSEVFKQAALEERGVSLTWVQDNHAYSQSPGVVRGLHFQAPPYGQAKIVRVLRGAILDVVVDLRRQSPTYGRHLAIELSAQNWLQLLIPVGFAHGLCTLEPDTEVLYKVSAPYAPACEGGVAWDDPALAIAWPVTPAQAVLSDRDRSWPRLADLKSPF